MLVWCVRAFRPDQISDWVKMRLVRYLYVWGLGGDLFCVWAAKSVCSGNSSLMGLACLVAVSQFNFEFGSWALVHHKENCTFTVSPCSPVKCEIALLSACDPNMTVSLWPCSSLTNLRKCSVNSSYYLWEASDGLRVDFFSPAFRR